VFVAKSEVKSWPVIGWLTQLGGTLFVDRGRRTHVSRVNDAIQAVLEQGALVVLFPEGTSSDGRTVLPFKSSLLEPAAQSAHPISVSAIQYSIEDGDAGAEVCYWGSHTFFRICCACSASAPSAPRSVLRPFNGPGVTASNWRCNCAGKF
jgi:1-acyl-sn-glycerol-3-phosphate acyltransferase